MVTTTVKGCKRQFWCFCRFYFVFLVFINNKTSVMNRDEWTDPLCFCEYFNVKNERSHILGCCCDCEDLDRAVDRLLCCRQVPNSTKSNMLRTFQDRLRIPWRSGARQISLDAILPIIIIPLLMWLAIQNVYCTIVVFVTLPLALVYLHVILIRTFPQSKFFLMWHIWSVVLLVMLFECLVVSFMEILPEENLALVVSLAGAFFCFYRVKTDAVLSHITSPKLSEIALSMEPVLNKEVCLEVTGDHTPIITDTDNDNSLSLNADGQWICDVCSRKVPPRTFHCRICQACILKRDHHCVWLDCCIGQHNRCYFVLGLLLALFGCLYGSNITLTTVCHPVILYGTILIPDDCTDVYLEYRMTLCFVGALYCLFIGIAVLIALLHQVFLISSGITGSEYRNSIKPIDKRSCFINWKRFLSCGD